MIMIDRALPFLRHQGLIESEIFSCIKKENSCLLTLTKRSTCLKADLLLRKGEGGGVEGQESGEQKRDKILYKNNTYLDYIHETSKIA